MRIVERNPFSLRGRILHYGIDDENSKISIYPIFSWAHPSYIEYLDAGLEGSDIVIVCHRNQIQKHLFSPQLNAIKRNPNLNLVSTEQFFRRHKNPTFHNIEIPQNVIDQHWAKTPIKVKLAFRLLAPFSIIYLRYFASEEKLTRKTNYSLKSVHDLPPQPKPHMAWVEALDDIRTKMLIDVMSNKLKQSANPSRLITVMCHPKMMTPLCRFLARDHGFELLDSEWHSIIE